MYKEASLIDRRPLALGSSSSKARPKAPSTCLWQRVWARFDADAASVSDQHWWGGTVVGFTSKSTRSGQATHLDIVWDDGDRMHIECDHFVCKSCSSDLARHTAEAGAVSTRRGVSVTCPLCRRRAKLEI